MAINCSHFILDYSFVCIVMSVWQIDFQCSSCSLSEEPKLQEADLVSRQNGVKNILSLLLQVSALLEKARQQYDICKDWSGMGECCLTLSLLRLNEDLLTEAYNNFHHAQPMPNVAGMLECTEVIFQFFRKRKSIISFERLFFSNLFYFSN